MFADCSCLPPPFWDLGKNARDLYSKNYNCGILAINGKSKSPLGIDFRAGGSHCVTAPGVNAYLESSYFWPEYRFSFSEKWSTENTLSSDFAVTDLFVKGISLGTGSQFSIETGKKNFFFKAGYEMELFNANVDFKIEPPTYLMRGSLVASLLGWIAGGQMIFDLILKKSISNSFSLGYYAPGFILHTNVTDGKLFSASIYQKLNENLQTCIMMAWNTETTLTEFGFGCVYEMDEMTSYRGKIDVQSQIGVGFSHRFNRGVLANFSACVDGKNFSCGHHFIGIGLELEA